MPEDSGPRFVGSLVRRGSFERRSERLPDTDFSGSNSVSGSKRSIKDRLGTRADDSLEGRRHQKHKRQKGEKNQVSQHRGSLNDAHLAKGDLRFQLMQKKDLQTDVDLRVKLSSKATLASADGKRLPEATLVAGKSRLETRDMHDDEQKNTEDKSYDGERKSMQLRGSVGAQSMPELRNSIRGQSVREHGDSVRRQNLREVGDTVRRQGMGDLGDVVGRPRMQELRAGAGRHSIGEPKDTYNVERRVQDPRDSYSGGNPSMLETRDGYDHGRQVVLGSVPSRMGYDVPAVVHARTSNSSLALDNPRRRSPGPNRMLSSSMARTLSLERNLELQRASIRTYDDGKSNVYRRNEVPSPHMPAGSAMHMRQPPLNALPPIPAAPVPLMTQFRPSILGFQNPGGQPSVDGFLQTLGLEKYSINFQQEEVDFHALRQMSDIDLKELKIPMGPRKKILQALLPPPPRR